MWIGILAACIAVAIGVIIGVKRGKEIKALQEEGKIIKRDMNYAEKGQEFTAKIGTFSALAQALKQQGIPCTAEGATSVQVLFSGTDFRARLYKTDFDEPSGIGVFRFEFTQWKMQRYTYANETGMNMLLTAVEKAFLSLDPNTGVATYPLNYKTKHSIF